MINTTAVCIVFKNDLIAIDKVNEIPNSKVFVLANEEELRDVFNEFEYIILVHSGNKVTNSLLMKLLMYSVEYKVKLGFIVHKDLKSMDLNSLYKISNGKRHALLNHIENANFQINTPEFWYGSGKEASFQNLQKWQHTTSDRPNLISFISHSREDLIYAVDGMVCSVDVTQNLDGANLPSCYTTGKCYRNDLQTFSINNLDSDLLVLNGCTNFKLSDEVFDSRSTLIGKLLQDGPRNIIGSPVIKVAHIEENFYIHSSMGEKDIGTIVLDLNYVYKITGSGDPSYALWGDPRIVYPKLINTEGYELGKLGGELRYTNLISNKFNVNEDNSTLDIREDFNIISQGYKSLDNYRTFQILGVPINSMNGLMSQLEDLLRGTNKLIADANLINNGRVHQKLNKKTIQIKNIQSKIESKIMENIVQKAENGGMELAEAYREAFIIKQINLINCPICKQKASEQIMHSPTNLERTMINCPTCGIPADYSTNMNMKRPQFRVRSSKNKISVIFDYYEGELGVAISAGKKYGFNSFNRHYEQGQIVFESLIEDVRPHRHQLKIYNLKDGIISSYQDILTIGKDGHITSSMELHYNVEVGV